MVVRTFSGSNLNLKRKLSAQWTYLMEMETSVGTTILVTSCQHLQSPLNDLPRQHYTALSRFADKNRHIATCMTLRSPLVRSWCMYQSLVYDSWPVIHYISISDSRPDGVVLLTMANECPHLTILSLCNNQLNTKTIPAMTLVTWPHLASLYLNCNIIAIAGVQYLVCSLPSLQALGLEHTGIDGPAGCFMLPESRPVMQAPALQRLY